MSDNTEAGFIVGNILSQASPPYPVAKYKIIQYKIPYTKFNRFFRISEDGKLSVAHYFDRDNMNEVCGPLDCCHLPNCIIVVDFKVTHSSSGKTFIQEVKIEIEDENDCTPKFPQLSFTINIPENERTFSEHRLPSALDDDSPKFGIKKYGLIGENFHYFSINQGINSSRSPVLRAEKVFDFENFNERSFDLFLYAEDTGGRSSKLKLLITIIDQNDNDPKFITNKVGLNITENTLYERPIYVFEARDLDSGDNGRITYDFSSTNRFKIGQIFNLNPDSGELFLTRKLDYETYSDRNLIFTVEAYDHGTPNKKDYCNIIITVTDINDNVPIIEITNEKAIPENKQFIEEVMKIFVRDEDSVDNVVNCQSLDKENADLELKRMSEQSYFLYAKRVFDYEITNYTSIDIKCFDSAKEPQHVTKTLIVKIEDLNDNKPIFEKSSYKIELLENFKLDIGFIQVKAIDKDAGEFGKVFYSLEEDYDLFVINLTSGELKLKKHLDRESRDNYALKIFGRDVGNLQGDTMLFLKVLDYNDMAPRLKSSSQWNLKENCKVGDFVGQLEIEDLDLGENGRVNWKVDMLGNSSSYLDMSDNSTVMVKQVIDREQIPFLYFVVAMNDYGNPIQEASATVTVKILDENDHIPRIVYPKFGQIFDKNEPAIVAINTPKYTSVLTLEAEDPDEGINAKVLYHLMPCNGSVFFAINQTSGELLTSWDYDSLSFTPTYPKEAVYEISFTAYNPVKSTMNTSASSSSHFFIKIGSYHHFNALDEQFYQRHKRPFFNNLVLLILIGGFTISLSAALIAAIVWAKSKFTADSQELQDVNNINDSKFVMMMMGSGNNNNNNNNSGIGGAGHYNPPIDYSMLDQQSQSANIAQFYGSQIYGNPYDSTYVSLIGSHDYADAHTIDHSRSSTFNSRYIHPHTQQKASSYQMYASGNYDTKSIPRSLVSPSEMHSQHLNIPTQQHYIHHQQQQQLSPSPSNLNPSVTSDLSPQQFYQKSANSFYRTGYDEVGCSSPTEDDQAAIDKSNIGAGASSHRLLTQNRAVHRPYATIPARVASICDPSSTTIAGSTAGPLHENSEYGNPSC